MSNSKRLSDRAGGRSLRMAFACAALALAPCGAALAQEAETGGTSPGPSLPAPSLQIEAPTAPNAAAEDHSGHLDMKPVPADAPVMPDVSEPVAAAPKTPASGASDALTFLQRGGPAIWSISALSIVALALILWKTWRLAMMGAWSGGRRVQSAVALWTEGREADALADLEGRRTCRAALVRTAMAARRDGTLDDAGARAETERVARGLIARARDGLRPLELIAAIAPLLGLLGTVLGMIAAFQALQEAGSRADPAILAGGIWEALLTTAAGMAVAIPASMALAWFESVVDRLRSEMEDAATRIFLRPTAQDTPLARAAE
ncbi:MotA/TolQ/ExbB proton channel family protein [Roseovarius sp. S4756]|uniref:MotA/TolQ/ExbB proton channel family protein n=1 Tax=Roseovarius maritimus TaxID=3342637 RepID=UPI0037271A32